MIKIKKSVLGNVHRNRKNVDITNEFLKKNVDALEKAAIKTAKKLDRRTVDIKTLKNTNNSLISTFNKVAKIKDNGRKRREKEEIELKRLEEELKGLL